MTCRLASYLDVAILDPELTGEEVLHRVQETAPLMPCTYCVRPVDIARVKPVCREYRIGICVVLGFPHGHQLPECKADEAQRYLAEGVDEIDMVCSIGAVRAGDWEQVFRDIRSVSALTRPAGVLLKVILETCFLSDPQIVSLVEACIEAQADFVKTSTGFNGDGPRDPQLRLMLDTANHRIQVKASGGIPTRERARELIGMGVARLGVSWEEMAAICGEESAVAEAT